MWLKELNPSFSPDMMMEVAISVDHVLYILSNYQKMNASKHINDVNHKQTFQLSGKWKFCWV